MVGQQVMTDLRRLPAIVRTRTTEAGRATRYGSIDELRTAARRSLPRTVFDFVDGAAGDEVTARRNRSAFDDWVLRPRVLTDVSDIDLTTTVLGTPIAMPVMAGPTGGTALVHRGGESALARAAGAMGTTYVLSSMGSQTIEQVAAATQGPKWFQLYMWRDRELVARMIHRAKAAGFEALVLTVDTPRAGARERDRRNGFSIPPRVTVASLVGGVVKPRWSWSFLRSPQIGIANVQDEGSAGAPIDLGAYGRAQFDAAVTWDSLPWVQEMWGGKLVLKGILTAEDARRAVLAGADGVVVSNHGGRQLDHVDASLTALGDVVAAVGNDVDVFLDGGIRRGSDVATAVALGARACLVGRAQLFGLGACGEPGARRALEILRDELELTMTLLGRPRVGDLAQGEVARPAASVVRGGETGSRTEGRYTAGGERVVG